MTVEELKIRQSWSLYQKIDHTIGAIEAFLNEIEAKGLSAYLSYSGGQDSTVLVDITRRFIRPSMKAVYCNTGNEWPEIVKFVRATENVQIIRPEMTVPQVLDKYGFPLISKEQSQYISQCRTTKSETVRNMRLNGKLRKKGYKGGKISQKWQFLLNEKFHVSDKCCECLKKRPFRKYEKETGEVPILGIMAEESDLRIQQYCRRGGCNSFNSNRIASHPMSIWTGNDIFSYRHEFKVPICEIYNVPGTTQTGCMFCGFGAHMKGDNRFERLFTLHPKAYLKFMNYTNNGVTYRTALRKIGIILPDENKQLKLF